MDEVNECTLYIRNEDLLVPQGEESNFAFTKFTSPKIASTLIITEELLDSMEMPDSHFMNEPNVKVVGIRELKTNPFTKPIQIKLMSKVADDSRDAKPFKCSFCGLGFCLKNNLQKHLQTHFISRRYKCTLCEASFGHQILLNRHTEFHLNEKPFVCTVCNASFTEWSKLRMHSYVHLDIKPFKCNECNVAFSQKNNLVSHKRTHSREKLYKCSQCDAEYVWKSTYKLHLQIHSKEKPFQCDHCEASFVHQGYLSKHSKVHSNTKSFRCPYCVATFKCKSNLGKHLKYHSEKMLLVQGCEVPDFDKTQLLEPSTPYPLEEMEFMDANNETTSLIYCPKQIE